MKQKSVFACAHCGYESPRWLGRCPGCGQWNSLEEQRVPDAPRAAHPVKGDRLPRLLTDISAEGLPRLSTGIPELDHVLGGGLVPGSVTLCGGDPGIGKSTLLLQAAGELAKGEQVLYVTAEESCEQVKMRADRLRVNAPSLYILAENELEEVLAALERESYLLVVLDSVQTVYSGTLQSAAGSVTQVRECAQRMMRYAKESNAAVLLVGHVTKDGALAGPKVLEHIVDTVLYFEGEKTGAYRCLRAVKNRFGPANEMGMFEMREEGMRWVENPSALLLCERSLEAGNAIYCALEGTRPLLMEVQALVCPTTFPSPRRACTGLDYNRLYMLLAVMEKRLGYRLSEADVYINIAGGLEIEETGADLAVLAALASAVRGVPLPPHCVFMGEVGLTGELRGVSRTALRLQESARHGFTQAYVPAGDKKEKVNGITPMPCKTARQALQGLFTDN